jgi:hypothetical protein
MSRSVAFHTGQRYYAGVDLPWYAPRAIITAGATDLGFRDIVWHPRSDTLPVNARVDPLYDDEWDEWATGVYRGPEKVEVLEHVPKWIAIEPAPPQTVQQAQTQPVQAQAPTTSLDQVMAIARVALETGDPRRIIATAQVLQNGGYAGLAVALRMKAAELTPKLVELAKKPATWAVLGALDLIGYAALALALVRRGRRRNSHHP